MAKHKLDPHRRYFPPETVDEYKKRLTLEARNFGWQLNLWAGKLELSDDLSVTTVRAALANLQERINRV